MTGIETGLLASSRVCASVMASRAASAAASTAAACWTRMAGSGEFGNAPVVASYAPRAFSNSPDDATIKLFAALTGYQNRPPYVSTATRIGTQAMRRICGHRRLRPRAARCGCPLGQRPARRGSPQRVHVRAEVVWDTRGRIVSRAGSVKDGCGQRGRLPIREG